VLTLAAELGEFMPWSRAWWEMHENWGRGELVFLFDKIAG